MSTNGNERLFTDDCFVREDVSIIKKNFPLNSFTAITSSSSIMRHTPTDPTPPKITNTLTKVSMFVAALINCHFKNVNIVNVTSSKMHVLQRKILI